jgi:O-antigen ligase
LDTATQKPAWGPAILVALPAAAFSVDARWGALACVASLSAHWAVTRPAWLLGALLALSSSDLWLTVDAGGFTFRAAHVMGVALCAAAVARVGLAGWLRFVVSLPGVGVWALFLLLQGVTVARGVPNPGKAVGYLAWALFDVAVVAPSVAWHLRQRPVRSLAMGWLLACGVAGFGLLQLGLALVGTDPPLVMQWVGARPRINALSYEPSYFAFQAMIPLALLTGLATSGTLRRFSGAVAAVGGLLTLTVLLSSSRSGMAGLLVLLVAWMAAAAWRRKFSVTLPARRVMAAFAAVLLLTAAYTPPHVVAADLLLFRRTVDLHDPSSAQPRKEGVLEALALFRLKPWTGFGPGQFGGALLAHPEQQIRVLAPHERNANEIVTFNLYAELLSEAGLPGLLCVLAAWGLALRALWRARGNSRWGRLAWALLWPSLLTMGVMYQFNQTLWRTETWCLLGLAWAGARRRAA